MRHRSDLSAPSPVGQAHASTGTEQVALKILRLPATCAKLGTSRSSVYRMVADGTLPRPIKLSKRAIGFLEHELDEFLRTRGRVGGGLGGNPNV